jgi:hypothetical protein
MLKRMRRMRKRETREMDKCKSTRVPWWSRVDVEWWMGRGETKWRQNEIPCVFLVATSTPNDARQASWDGIVYVRMDSSLWWMWMWMQTTW